MKTIKSHCGNQNFAVTAFGVNLLYEGLLLEIDASAVANAEAVMIRPADSRNANWTAESQGVRLGQYCHISGQSIRPAESTPLQASIEEALQECLSLLGDLGADASEVGRLTVLVSDRSSAKTSGAAAFIVRRAVEEAWPGPAVPAVSAVLVEGLPGGAAVQIDAFAIVVEQ
jgi:enamine deaminase RidA (YjgF/YER057c/UK114 family)